MTNIFQRLDATVNADGITADLAGQIEKITAIVETLQSLVKNPPSEIGDIVSALGNLPLPDLSVGAGLGAAFAQIGDLLPTDVTEFTGDVQAKLDDALELVNEINAPMQDVLQASQALYRLTEIDWNCADPATGDGSANGGGGPGGGDPAPDDPAETRDGVSVAATNQVVAEANGTLDLFPNPFTVESVIETLALFAVREADGALRFLPVPVLDELGDSLNTVTAWRGMNAVDLQTALNDALSTLATLLRQLPDELLLPLGTVATDLNTELPFTEIDGALGALATAYTELADAVLSADLSGVAGTIANADTALTDLQNLLPDMSAPARVALLADACKRLHDLPEDLANGIERYVAILEAPPEVESVNRLLEKLSAAIGDNLPAFGEGLGVPRLLEQLQELVAALDFATIQEPINSAATALEGALAQIDQAFIQLGVRLQGVVGDVDDVVGAVDPAALLAETTASINTYRDDLSNQLSTAFAPARTAIEAAVANLESVIGEFNPQEVVAAIESVLDEVTGVLGDVEVVALVEKIRGALEEIATQFDALRFAPLTDEVINGIEELDGELREITSSDIPAAAKAALKTALAVLPKSIKPLTNPLIAELDELIDAGPVRLLEQIKAQPAKAMDRVREFEPGKLVGEHLTPQFNAALAEVEAFRPSQLLSGIETEFESAKQGLTTRIDPGQALAPLQAPFERTDALVRQLDPARLIAPLDQLLAEATSQVVDVLPIEEFFDQFDLVIGRVTAIHDSVTGVRDLLARIIAMLDTLSNPEPALDAMLDPLRTALADITDAGFLQPGIAVVQAAVGELRAAPLRSRVNDVLLALETALDDLNPASRLTDLVQRHSAFPNNPLTALPDSAEKTAVQALLTRMNPLAVGFAEPLRPVIDLHDCFNLLADRLNARFADWDATMHAPDTAFGELGNLDGNPAAIRALLLDEVLQTQFVQPFARLFELLLPVRLAVGALTVQFTDLLETVAAQITALTGGPGSLTSIRDSIGGILARFENLNLSVVSDALRAPIDTLRSNLRALDPKALAVPLRESLTGALAELDFDLIIAPADIAAVDAAFGNVIDTLRAVDPERIVTDRLQPTFDATVRPLIDALDVSDLLNQIAERLDQLVDELGSELTRVDQAYKLLQQGASAASGGASVSA